MLDQFDIGLYIGLLASDRFRVVHADHDVMQYMQEFGTGCSLNVQQDTEIDYAGIMLYAPPRMSFDPFVFVVKSVVDLEDLRFVCTVFFTG
mmetsp:Transcript_62070/g.160164  ORF Transcript_62070/g.160164 Transcript_62070/m.160164 type:complete len:91 (-) Transcript_62070:476-748(-)